MREMLIGAARTYYMGMINKHIANVEILLTNPVGIGEDSHQDIQAVFYKTTEARGRKNNWEEKVSVLLRVVF